MPNMSASDVEELESLQELTGVRGWRILKNLLTKHRQYCVEQAHKYLEKHEDRKSGEWLARAKEPTKLLSLVHDRKQELNKIKEGD